MLDGGYGEGQLHHGAEGGLGRTASRDHQLMVLIWTGAEEYQRRLEGATHAAVGLGQAEDGLVERHHALDIGDKDTEMGRRRA